MMYKAILPRLSFILMHNKFKKPQNPMVSRKTVSIWMNELEQDILIKFQRMKQLLHLCFISSTVNMFFEIRDIDNHFYFLLLIDSISLLKNLINLQNDNQQLMGIMSEVKSIWQIISQWQRRGGSRQLSKRNKRGNDLIS